MSAGRVEDERPSAGVTRQEPVPGPRRRTAGQTDAAGRLLSDQGPRCGGGGGCWTSASGEVRQGFEARWSITGKWMPTGSRIVSVSGGVFSCRGLDAYHVPAPSSDVMWCVNHQSFRECDTQYKQSASEWLNVVSGTSWYWRPNSQQPGKKTRKNTTGI